MSITFKALPSSKPMVNVVAVALMMVRHWSVVCMDYGNALVSTLKQLLFWNKQLLFE